MPSRQDETVAVRPTGLGGTMPQMSQEENRSDVCHAHRHAGMAGLCTLDSVHCQAANGIGDKL